MFFQLLGCKVMSAWQPLSVSFGYLVVCGKEAREEVWSRHHQWRCSPWRRALALSPQYPIFSRKLLQYTKLVLGPACLAPVSDWQGCRVILWNAPWPCALAETTACLRIRLFWRNGHSSAKLLDCCQASVRFDFSSSHQGYPIHLY